jgi:cation-transporting ATPase 13A1
MITGDAPLTACFAASKVHIVTRSVVILSHCEEETGHTHGLAAQSASREPRKDSEYQWVSPDEHQGGGSPIPFERSLDSLLKVASQYDLAVSGDALSFLESIKMADTVIPLCQVSFACHHHSTDFSHQGEAPFFYLYGVLLIGVCTSIA